MKPVPVLESRFTATASSAYALWSFSLLCNLRFKAWAWANSSGIRPGEEEAGMVLSVGWGGPLPVPWLSTGFPEPVPDLPTPLWPVLDTPRPVLEQGREVGGVESRCTPLLFC